MDGCVILISATLGFKQAVIFKKTINFSFQETWKNIEYIYPVFSFLYQNMVFI